MAAARIVVRAALFGALFVVVGAGVVRAEETPTDVIATVDGQPPIDRATVDR